MKQLLILTFCCFSSLILAQNTSEQDSIAWDLDLEDIVVTAQYAPTASENAIHPIKVLKIEEIQQQGQLNLAEVLSNQLNLRVNTDPILGNGLRIQGIGGENIQIMIDGVPVIGRVGGNIDLSQINLQNVQRIEIIEGAMSAQYGSNASGGVVNIITQKSQLQRWNAQLQNQYENIGIRNHALTIGHQGKQLYTSITGAYNNNQFAPTDSLRLQTETVLPSGEIFNTKLIPWNPKTQYNLDATLRYQFHDSLNLTYQYRWFDEELANYGEVRRPQFRPYTFDEFYHTRRATHSLNLETYIDGRFYLNSTTAFNDYERRKETQRLDIEPDTTSLVEGGQDTISFQSILHRSTLSTLSNRLLNGQFGLEILHETGAGQRILDPASTLPNETSITNFAFWSSLRYELEGLVAQANLRYGYNSKYDHPLIPSLNLSWKAHPNWQVQASFASGFRAPSLKELHFNFIDINHYIVGNPDLQAERSTNASLVLTHDVPLPSQHQIKLTGKLFYNYIKNRIIIAEFAPVQFNYQNLAQFETNGFNLNLNYNFGENFAFQSGLAYTNLYNTWSESSTTNKFTGLYEMQQQLSWQMPKIKTNFVLTHRFIGRQIRFYEDGEGTISEGYVGGYNLLNATWSRHFWGKRIFLAIGSKNLLNIETVPFLGQSDSAHGSVGNSQLLNWGRTYFIRCNLQIN